MKPANKPLLSCLALLLGAASASAAAQDFPKRKSGLWEITMGAGRPTMQHCVDHSRDDALRQFGQQMADEMKCTRSNLKMAGGSFSFDQSCQMPTMKWTSSVTVTGSFDSAYKMEMDTKYDPPLMGKTERKTVIDARWVGNCKTGQRPGDVVMPGGVTMNVYDMIDSKKK